ncbi:MAG: LysM peptidoglycan-binding domain-containing protein [bacterium]
MISQRWLGVALAGCAVWAVPVFAQYNDPAMAEDAAIERTRLLRAADQIDTVTRQISEMQQDMQASRREMDLLREDVTSLRSENGRLKKDLTASEDKRVQERDAILMEVAKIVAQKKKGTSSKSAQENEAAPVEESKSKPETKEEPQAEDVEKKSDLPDDPPKSEPAVDIKPDAKEKPQAQVKKEEEKEEGYEHVVEKGQTLWIIAQAYQKKGVHVTVEDICKANDMKPGDKLRVGQRLFIPNKK